MTNKLIPYFLILFFITASIFGCKKVNNDCNVSNYPNAPKKSWFISHKGSDEEAHGHYILECKDGGYLQVGETGKVSKSSKILVVKTNKNGALLWKKEIFLSNHNLGNSALEIQDGYIVCGSQDKNSTIIKLNKSDGSIIFNQSINNGGCDAFEQAIKTPNGFIAIGYINGQDQNNTFYTEGEGYLTFLNNNGIKIKGKKLNLSHPYRIEAYKKEIFISGLTDGANDFGLIKTDSLGNIIWSKKFGGLNADHCFGMDLSNDGSILLTGHTLSGTENWDTYTMKINNNGIQEWEAKQGNPRGFKPKYIHDEAWGIKATNDGGCIVIAGTGDEYGIYSRRCGNDGDNSNTWHVYVIKYGSSGNIEWQKTFGGGEGKDWAGEDIELTSDGGVIIAVDDGGFGFLKLNPF